MKEHLHEFAVLISNHGNAALSKSLQYIGVGGASVGAAGSYLSKHQETVETGMSLADWGGVVGILGGLTLIIKNGVDVWLQLRRDRRDQANKDGE